MTTTTPAPYQPDVTKYRAKGLSVERLDQLASFVFEGNAPSTLGAVIATIKLVVALTYIIARKYMIDSELEIEKQQWEQDEIRRNRDDINRSGSDIKR